jgi:hypothetical protein
MNEIETAKQELLKINQKDAELTRWFGKIEIKSAEDRQNFMEILGDAKIAYKKAKAMQDNLLEPLEEAIKRIKILFKPKLDEYSNAIKEISAGLNTYYTNEKKLTQQQVVTQAQDYWDKRTEAKETGEVPPLPELGVSSVAKTFHHNMGTTNMRPHIKVTIVTASLVPREYCVPDESLLRKAGELAFGQNKENPIMPHIEGAIIEVEYIPVSRQVK